MYVCVRVCVCMYIYWTLFFRPGPRYRPLVPTAVGLLTSRGGNPVWHSIYKCVLILLYICLYVCVCIPLYKCYPDLPPLQVFGVIAPFLRQLVAKYVYVYLYTSIDIGLEIDMCIDMYIDMCICVYMDIYVPPSPPPNISSVSSPRSYGGGSPYDSRREADLAFVIYVYICICIYIYIYIDR